MKANLQRVKIKDLSNWSFWIFVFTAIISEHSIIGNMGLALFCGATIVSIFKIQGTARVGLYNVLEIVFVIFCCFHTFGGFAVNSAVARGRLITLIVCCAFNLCLYNYILVYKDWKSVLNKFISAACCGMIILIIVDFKSFISGRFGTNDAVGINILGARIGGVNATMIGYLAMIGFLCTIILYDTSKTKMQLYFFAGFFAVMMLVSGTRKVLLMIPLIFVAERYFKQKTRKLATLIKLIIALCVVVIVGYIAIMNIPALYNSIGNRVFSLITFLREGTTVEGSIITRQRLITRAQDAFHQRQWLGWGLDNFKYSVNDGGYYAHNNFYEILVSVGIIGFVVYYIKYFYVIKNAIHVIKNANEEYKLLLKTLTFFVVCAIVLEYWQVTYFYRLLMIPFSFLAAISKLSTLCDSDDERN